MNTYNLPTWEYLAKELTYRKLAFAENLNILDFGSGNGASANHFASNNTVVAVEPSDDMLKNRIATNSYTQIKGGLAEISQMKSNSFDMILCHNVLEYAENREDIITEFYRLLKKDGILSIIKHNRNGRIMQMAVLLNNFEDANNLLDGKNSEAVQFGAINYYEDNDIPKWCNGFKQTECYGMRTFWDLQQNQEIQSNTEWQEAMLRLEERVSEIHAFREIAFFHHLIFKKV